MKSAARPKVDWHEEGDDVLDAIDSLPPRSLEQERWRRAEQQDPLAAVKREIATLKSQREEDQRSLSEVTRELRSLRGMLAPPDPVLPADPHYAWAISNQAEVRKHAGRWIGINVFHGGIVADGDRMIDVRNALRARELLLDSYVVYVPPA